MKASRRVLIIGLDGGNWNVLRPLMEAGFIPNLSQLSHNGASGILQSTIPPLTPVAWSSFQTGTNPGKHGIFHFSRVDPERQSIGIVSSRSIQLPTIWELVSEHGKKVISINVPMTYPPKPVNGLMISGILTPNSKVTFTYPSSLQDWLKNQGRTGWIVMGEAQRTYLAERALKPFIDNMLLLIQNRTEVALRLLTDYQWDLFMVHFQAVDLLQHRLWHYLDPQHPSFNREKWEYIASRFFGVLDQAIGDLVGTAKGQCDEGRLLTVLISDHGFRSNFRVFFINNWLLEAGFGGSGFRNPIKRLYRAVIPWLVRLDIRQWRRKLLTGSKRRELINLYNAGSIAHSKVFAVGGGWGLMFYGDAADDPHRIKEALVTKLLNVRDPVGDHLVIEAVYERDAIYKGPKLEHLPDFVAQPRAGYSISAHYSPRAGRLFADVDYRQMGAHDLDGILVCEGTEVKPGIYLDRAELIDIAPTILCYLGLPVPEHMDGTVLDAVFQPPVGEATHVSYTESVRAEAAALEQVPEVYRDAEKNQVEGHLRALGYLD